MRDDSCQGDECLHVRSDRAHGPYLLVATAQVPQVCVLFDSVGLTYSLEESEASLDESETEPPITTMIFDETVKSEEIQRLLDEMD